MNELMELSKDIKQIELEIKHHKNIAGQSIWEIGRRLNHVKENDLAHGEFIIWVENNLEIGRTQASKFMRIAKEFPDVQSTERLGVEALYMIATLPEEERAKEHTLETGAVKQVDEMTVRELQEVKRKLNQKERELQDLKNKPPQIIEKEVIKEVEPEDYQYIKRQSANLKNTVDKLKYQVETKDLEIGKFVHEKNMLERKAKLNEKEATKYKNLKSQIENLSQEKNELGRQIRTRTELSGLVVRVEHFLKTELAPIKYSRAIREASDDELVNDNLKEIVDRVQDWCNEMYEYVKDNDIIDTEVIYNE